MLEEDKENVEKEAQRCNLSLDSAYTPHFSHKPPDEDVKHQPRKLSFDSAFQSNASNLPLTLHVNQQYYIQSFDSVCQSHVCSKPLIEDKNHQSHSSNKDLIDVKHQSCNRSLDSACQFNIPNKTPTEDQCCNLDSDSDFQSRASKKPLNKDLNCQFSNLSLDSQISRNRFSADDSAESALPELLEQKAPKFVEPVSDEHICHICKGVLKDAVQSVCGHRFCKLCAESKFSENVRVRCPANEEDCEDLLITDTNPDMTARKDVGGLQVQCIFQDQGCNVTTKLRERLEHARGCQNRSKHCPYGSNDNHVTTRKRKTRKGKQHKGKLQGKTEKGNNEKVKQHNNDDFNSHIECTSFLAKIKENVFQVRRDIQCTHAEQEAYKRELENFKHDCEAIRRDEIDLKSEIKDLMMRIVSQCEKTLTLERTTEGLASKSEVTAQTADIQNLKQLHQMLTERIERLERERPRGGSTSNQTQDYQRIQAHIVDQLGQQDRQIGIHDIRLAELDLRFQILETASYGGVCIWKIRDYSRRKQEAITSRTLSLYSQPFYSDQFGYKMCARVYLNGDGIGKGTHLSLYFVVMRGEYDVLLHWPFRKRVTLSLLDQDRSGRDIVERFDPDTSSDSFSRPTREMNIATGCPQFVTHNILETTTYIKDDTLFLKIDVSGNSSNIAH